ncbi:uncharacterized protein LOC105437031 [Strongylocentrotus purpuratus]|uniref:Death domain-containing protein n=1 Tax=Strongylocentrotus purpuratus TaxID=7668 RepID=A0A7M7PQH5_STRPU|nr:uncharacterized protein LOC105437031 [Strongylocentrotus purpuratus]
MRIPLESNRYVIHTDRFELQLDHFCWGIPTMIWLCGNSESQGRKRMLSTPFIPKTLPEDQGRPILHLRFYNKLPVVREEILAEEESINYKKISPEVELIVEEHSIDMSISCLSVPSTQTKIITAKKLMQLTKHTECMSLLHRRSEVTLIINQESEITMTFWTDITGSRSLNQPQHISGTIMVDRDALFDELSKEIPAGKYTTFCKKIGVGYNEAKTMLTRCKEDYNVALRDLLSQWVLRMKGDTRKQLEDALDGADVGGLCSIVEKHYEKRP